MCVAGFFGSDSAWNLFASKWKATIAPRSRLHMNRLGWQGEASRKMLVQAGLIPRECGLVPVIASVTVADYRFALRKTPLEKVFTGYSICCYTMALKALQRLPHHERLKIVLGDQGEHGEMAKRAIETLMMSPIMAVDGVQKLAGVSFMPAKGGILIDPADYLAFAYLQRMRHPGSKKDQWCSPILDGYKLEEIAFHWTASKALKTSVDTHYQHQLSRLQPVLGELEKLIGSDEVKKIPFVFSGLIASDKQTVEKEIADRRRIRSERRKQTKNP